MNALFIHIFLLSTTGPFIVGCAQEHAPKIVFEKTTHEFSENLILNAYKEITVTFPFSNKGNAPLNIQALDADCGCIATKTSAEQIPPGGTGEIHVKVEREIGHFTQNVYVYSNTPDTPIVILQVAGYIVPPIQHTKAIQFGAIVKGSKIETRALTLQNFTEAEVSIASYTSSAPGIEVDIPEKVIPAGGIVKLQPSLSLDTVGFYNETVTLHLDDKDNTELVVQLKGRVLGTINAVPRQLFLGVFNTSTIQRELQIESDINHPFTVTHIKSNHFHVTAPLDLQPRVAHKLQLTCSVESRTKGLIEDTLRVQTDSTDVPYIDIPLKAILP